MRSKDVDPVKCPALHAALLRKEEREASEWQRVVELRKVGRDGSAKRLVKKILGVQKAPMPQDRKEYLDQYKAEHKQEIADRERQEREIRRRTIALLTTGRRKK